MIYFKIQKHIYSSSTSGENLDQSRFKTIHESGIMISDSEHIYAILGSLISKSVSVLTSLGIVQRLKNTLVLYLQYDLVNVIFGPELGACEHGDMSFYSIQDAKILESLDHTSLSVRRCVSTSITTSLSQATDQAVIANA
jgi:hypothetical protein